MITKPALINATIIKDSISTELHKYATDTFTKALSSQIGKREIGTCGDFSIGSTFTLIRHEFANNSEGYACEGTKDWLSIFKMSGGANNLWAFEKEGCEKSEDYDSIPAAKILDIPEDRDAAIQILNENYIGKTFRAIARSGEKCHHFGLGKYYLFAVED